jgi:hypothetical protein
VTSTYLEGADGALGEDDVIDGGAAGFELKPHAAPQGPCAIFVVTVVP